MTTCCVRVMTIVPSTKVRRLRNALVQFKKTKVIDYGEMIRTQKGKVK